MLRRVESLLTIPNTEFPLDVHQTKGHICSRLGLDTNKVFWNTKQKRNVAFMDTIRFIGGRNVICYRVNTIAIL